VTYSLSLHVALPIYAEPKLIVSASCGIEPSRVIEYKPLLEDAIRIATAKPERCIIYQRPQQRAPLVAGRDIDWNDAMNGAHPVRSEEHTSELQSREK